VYGLPPRPPRGHMPPSPNGDSHACNLGRVPMTGATHPGWRPHGTPPRRPPSHGALETLPSRGVVRRLDRGRGGIKRRYPRPTERTSVSSELSAPIDLESEESGFRPAPAGDSMSRQPPACSQSPPSRPRNAALTGRGKHRAGWRTAGRPRRGKPCPELRLAPTALGNPDSGPFPMHEGGAVQ